MRTISPSEVAEFLARYQSAWHQLDPAALAEVWDRLEPEPVYIAEEIDEPLTGWKEIEAHWATTCELLGNITVEARKVRSGALADGVSWILSEIGWKAQFNPDADASRAPLGGVIRGFLIVRRVEGTWKLIHYIESPLGELPFVRMMYERAPAE